jgi:hypothetical protein
MRIIAAVLLGLLLVATPARAQSLSMTDGTAAGFTAGSGVLVKATALNLNAVADTALTVAAAKYIVRKVVVTNCSTAPVLAQVALYTGAGATGTTVVAAATITALTGATKFLDMTMALTTDVLTASTLYARNAVAQTSALTCDVYVIGDVLP